MAESPELRISLFLQISHRPPVLDLSGANPFDINLQIRRSSIDLTRQMTILKQGSIFDIPYAFTHGLLRLIDMESEAEVILTSSDISELPVPSDQSTTLDNAYLILPARLSKLRRLENDYVMPLQLSTYLTPFLKAGCRYRVELNSQDLDVKWWAYGPLEEPRQASESARLVAPKYTQKGFLVVESLSEPPPVSVSMSLPSDVLHRDGSTPFLIRISITNKGDRVITVRSSGDQSFISPESDTTPNHRRITSVSPPPSLSNFSIVNCVTGEDLMDLPRQTCSLGWGSRGWPRRGLTTLEPGVSLVHDVEFIRDNNVLKTKMENEDREYVLRLRPCGIWWTFGSVDHLFGEEKYLKKVLNWSTTLPLILASNDELRFWVVD